MGTKKKDLEYIVPVRWNTKEGQQTKWYIQLSYGRDPVTKKRRRKRFGPYLTYEDAADNYYEVLAKAHKEKKGEPKRNTSSLTFGEFAEQFIKFKRTGEDPWKRKRGRSRNRKSRILKASTIQGYESILKTHILPEIGDRQLNEINDEDLDDVIDFASYHRKSDDSEEERQLSGTSLERIYALLRLMFNLAMKKKLISVNPILAVEAPEIESFTAKLWTPKEKALFLEEIKNYRLFAAYWLMITHGARRSEVAGLKWSYVELEAGAMTYQAPIVVADEGAEDTLKSGSEEKTIWLPPLTVEVLKGHKKLCEKEASKFNEIGTKKTNEINSEFLFRQWTTGKPVRADTLSQYFTRKIKQMQAQGIEISTIRLHDNRHGVSKTIRQSSDNLVASRILGHKKPLTTEQHYGHTDLEEQHEPLQAVIDEITESGFIPPTS